MTKIDPMKSKLKGKINKGHRKSCLRMETHANGTESALCHLHDFPFSDINLLWMESILVVQFPNPDFLEHISCNY